LRPRPLGNPLFRVEEWLRVFRQCVPFNKVAWLLTHVLRPGNLKTLENFCHSMEGRLHFKSISVIALLDDVFDF
jgi:hypothetical protein